MGQLRVASSADGAIVLGWDMTAAIAMAQALGVEPLIAAECLPVIEAVMVRKFNDRRTSDDRTSPPRGR